MCTEGPLTPSPCPGKIGGNHLNPSLLHGATTLGELSFTYLSHGLKRIPVMTPSIGVGELNKPL